MGHEPRRVAWLGSVARRAVIDAAKGVVAFPYRLRFGALGQSPRIMPPLLLLGARRVLIGDHVIIEQFAGLSVARGGKILIGDRCELRCFCRLEAHDGLLRLGERCSVNPFTLLSGFGGLTIGNDVRIGSHCVILSSTHQFDQPDLSIREQGVVPRATVIEDDVWFGAGCTVLGGVRIGRGAVIGAGAVVTRDLPAGSIAMGVPARVSGSRHGLRT